MVTHEATEWTHNKLGDFYLFRHIATAIIVQKRTGNDRRIVLEMTSSSSLDVEDKCSSEAGLYMYTRKSFWSKISSNPVSFS